MNFARRWIVGFSIAGWVAMWSSLAQAAPQRVISLAPHATELIAAAGGEALLVGVTQSCNLPASVTRLPRVSGAAGVNFEKLIALKPDLVVVWPGGNRPQDIARLRRLGIALMESEPKTVDDIARDIRRLGERLGTQSIAEQAISVMVSEIDAIKRLYAGEKTGVRSVFYQLGASHLFTLNDAHPVMELLQTCGGRNVFGHLAPLAPQVTLEAVIKAHPELIVVASARDLDDAKKMWTRHRRAFGENPPKLIAVDGERLHRPTPRLVAAAKAMCEGMRTLQ